MAQSREFDDPLPHARYKGHRKPKTEYSVESGKEVPTWSTSLLHCLDNPRMCLCALTGIGVCVIHGHVHDALVSDGCCLSCCQGIITPGECGRQRRHFRHRFGIPANKRCGSCFGDCMQATFCFPLTAMQEARELEVRSRRRWTPLKGFRGRGEDVYSTICGEENFDRVLVGYFEKPRDILKDDGFETGDSK